MDEFGFCARTTVCSPVKLGGWGGVSCERMNKYRGRRDAGEQIESKTLKQKEKMNFDEFGNVVAVIRGLWKARLLESGDQWPRARCTTTHLYSGTR